MNLPVILGAVAATLFAGSHLPMLHRALRTRDLRSYSVPSLVLANAGNVLYAGYVYSLPLGPLWFLHAFYLTSTAVMLSLRLAPTRIEAREDRSSP